MKKLFSRCLEPRGIALVVVLALMALLVLMAVAMLSISESEVKAARIYSDGQEAKQLSDVAVNIVISQLRKATSQGSQRLGDQTWVSQPGLVRRYSVNGIANEAYKLYSSSNMILRHSKGVEADLMAETPPANWNQLVNRYVDLNAPLARVNAEGNPVLLFPIVDPRAMSDNGIASIGGFKYQGRSINGSPVAGVVMTGGAAQRVPMPVEWIYLLKDGSIGVLSEAGEFVGQVRPTHENPMVGRIAFWADDEACKVNINTASEPTFWAVPTFTHQQDGNYAQFQPVNGEFQRYPGHPATTALSPVLLPGQQVSVEQKESLYKILPKIAPGGSVAGTKKYFGSNISAVNIGESKKERLFASVDELLLKEDRTKNVLNGEAFSPDTIQRAAFFLTTSSRAPEINPFGLPKVAIWPVSYRGNDFRTAYDQLMAHCSTLKQKSGSRSYIFQRGWADSLNLDVEKTENAELLQYLKRLLTKPIPGLLNGEKASFASKYKSDLPQILVEIFDYIRATNLCDGNLVKDSEKSPVTGMTILLGYAPGTTRRSDFKTFTDPLSYASASSGANAENGLVEGNGYPGYGQTTPSRWKYQGLEVQGIGRFPTISEVGLHFICCADNTKDNKNPDDDGNPYPEVYPFLGKPGGRGAPRKDASGGKRWFSNFPPMPKPNPAANEAPDFLKYPKTEGYPYGADKMHPGYQKVNWNHQLEPNKPLRPGVRRVQARILLEFFVPAAGFPQIQPELTIRVRGLTKLKLNDQHLFPNDEEFLWTGPDDIRTPNNIRTGGHGLGITSLIGERFLPERFPMPADNGWGGSDWIIKPSEGVASENFCAINHDLVSNFIDVDVGVDGSRFMNLSGSSHASPIQIEIWSGHYGRKATSMEIPAQLVQTLHVPIPAALLPPPTLIRNSLGEKAIIRSTENPEPVAFWTFYSKGALGFNVESLKKASPHPSRNLMGGRFFNCNGGSSGGEPTRGACIYGYDYPDPGVTVAFKPRSGVKFNLPDLVKAENEEGCDVVQSVQIAHGDYRLIAALPVVPADAWAPHRYYGKRRLAHNFRAPAVPTHPGFDYGSQSELNNQLVSLPSDYSSNWKPDLPRTTAAGSLAQRYGDFDNIVWNPDGPYINKPDEGNLVQAQSGRGQIAYFNLGSRSMGKMFFSPNRMVSSPVMFGSLPSGVQTGVPWRTLLFRPQEDHFGASLGRGGFDPPDHLFLEFFWMPIVEPYAISGPLSTAGKINMNYQMFPFTHIQRATGMHSILTGVQFSAVPATDAEYYKNHPSNASRSRDVFWTREQGKNWHHEVDIEKTLMQFDGRFASCKAFVHPSEICSLYLVPKSFSGTVNDRSMKQFWTDHRLTGDNVRERPYAAIYPRLTTRSNAFRVHYIAQTIKKSRTDPVDQIGVDDRVSGEYRGSTLIERYFDSSGQGLPDFADPTTTQSLEDFHLYRVLDTRRFGF